jgi:hypothetical protein
MRKELPLEHAELPQEIMSVYLDSGVSTEQLRIKKVKFDLEARTATALVDVDTDFENLYEGDKDNSYHWSAITAYRAVSQLAVGYICTELGMLKKEIGEIMQISSTMNTREPITQTRDVPIKVKFPKYVKRPTRLLGELEFDIADRKFYGTCRFAVDL